jgi:phosphoribosylanthranilate isomerase
MVFRIKICGITSVEDSLAAVDAGADAIGLNFFQGSPRHVNIPEARRIIDELRAEVDQVGVFVNASADEIRSVCRETSLQLVQLHGDEPPELLKSLNQQFDIIRARRLDARGTRAIEEDINACRVVAGFAPDAVLIDATAADSYGGTGQTVDWRQLVDYDMWTGGIRLILAGGLRPDNVAEAIQVVRPHAVDVASGVESSPGKKDAFKMRDFAAAAKAAFA